jgi:glycosyltransferase involved in cell wall biosynthesis
MKYCAVYYRKDSDDGEPFHNAHRAWIKLIQPEAVTSFIPDFISTKKFGTGLIGQMLSFMKGLVVPSAEAYILEGIASLPSVAFKKGKKIVINSDTFVRQLATMSGLRRTYALWLMNKADGFISTSDMMKDMTEEYSNKPNEVVYPGADLKAFEKIRPDLKSGNICSVGLSVFPKGTDILVESFDAYRKKYPNTTLFVLGEDPYRKKIQGKENIVAPGRTDPKQYLSQSTICMNTSRHDSFGINIIEAMAAGVIPIVSENCGAKTFVNRIDKRLVAPLDADVFAQRAEWVVKSSKLSEYSKKARQVAKEFEKESSPAKFKNAVDSILRKIQ